MKPLTLALTVLSRSVSCPGSYLVPLNGQPDSQRRADGKECQQLAAEAGNDARIRMQESIRRANERKTTAERAGEIAGTVALALVVPLFAQPAPPPEEVYWAAYSETYKTCYESRGYRYATPDDYN